MAASTNIPSALTGEPLLFTLDIIVQGGATAEIVQIAGIIDPRTISIGGGETDGEGVPMGNGGRAWKQEAQKDITIDFDAYTVGVHSASANSMLGLEQYYDGQTLDTTEAILTENTRSRCLVRATILWTEDTTVTSATGAVAVSKYARRYSLANARFVKLNGTYSDMIWKVSVSLKGPPFKKTAVSNKREESGDGSAVTNAIPALAAYTTTTNF